MFLFPYERQTQIATLSTFPCCLRRRVFNSGKYKVANGITSILQSRGCRCSGSLAPAIVHDLDIASIYYQHLLQGSWFFCKFPDCIISGIDDSSANSISIRASVMQIRAGMLIDKLISLVDFEQMPNEVRIGSAAIEKVGLRKQLIRSEVNSISINIY